MKVAIFHNYMDNIGGAEKVSLLLAKELNADIYTTNIDKEKIGAMGFSTKNIFSIGKIPLNAPFRQQLALYRFRKLDLREKYDFYIIAGDWAISAAANNKPNLWYVHSPIREIWDLYQYTRKKNVSWYKRPLFDVWVKYNRYLNRKYVKKVNHLVCNSSNTKKRVKKYLRRDAKIIYPPIDTTSFANKKKENFWLSVNRLISHKRVEMQIKAFEKLPKEKLVIVGSYEKSAHFKAYAQHIKKIKPKNVEIRSWVSDSELRELYSECKGFITTSKEEDFGMTVVEAMASGKAVIAPNEGGYRETVINEKTGFLIEDINDKKIINAINKINRSSQPYKDNCIKQAKKFDKKIFLEKIRKQIENE